MNPPTTQISAAYAAARDGAALWMPRAADVLQLSDADRLDFLQRMTTNNILALQPGASCVTVLTSPTAKIVHVFTVLAESDRLWLLPAAGEGAALERNLRGQIFFMDKVRMAKSEAASARLRVVGPGAEAVLVAAGLAAPVEEGTWRRTGEVTVVKQTTYDLPGYELIAPDADRAAWVSRLGIPLLDAEAYTARRIELGRPSPGAELTAEYNPLEAGLAWACAENKGCYTGQEIIARQITYDKVTRTLVGLRSEAPLSAGAGVNAEDREVGKITSAAFSPALQSYVALAILKRPYNAPATVVFADGIEATVTALPLA